MPKQTVYLKIHTEHPPQVLRERLEALEPSVGYVDLVAETDLVQHALGILERDYAEDVKGVAETLADEIRSGAMQRDEFLDRLHEVIDGHQNVIYTQAAQIVALVSRNEDAFVDSMGTSDLVREDAINWPGIAFFAMERDVLEALDRMGLDVNDEATFDKSTED